MQSSFGLLSPIIVETSADPLTRNSPLSIVLWMIKMEEPQESGKSPHESYSPQESIPGTCDGLNVCVPPKFIS